MLHIVISSNVSPRFCCKTYIFSPSSFNPKFENVSLAREEPPHWPLGYSAGVTQLEAPNYKCEALIIGGLGAEPPARSRGRALGQGSGSEAP